MTLNRPNDFMLDSKEIKDARGTFGSVKDRLSDFDSQIGVLQGSLGKSIDDYPRIAPENDDTGRFQRALDDMANGGTLLLSKATYIINGSLSAVFNVGVNITAIPGTIIDGSNSTSVNLITLGGNRKESSSLSADSVKNTKTIQTSLSLAEGDIILITSTDLFNSTRAYYYKGEMAEVESVSGTTVTLKGTLYDNYAASTTTVHKLNIPKISVSNLTIKRNSNHAGLKISYAKDIDIHNLSISGARERGIEVGYIYGGDIRNCYVTDCYYAGTGTSYGLAIISSQSLNITGGKYLGGRHGITHGGNEPVRDIIIDGATVGNHSSSSSGSLDVHGNCEFITIRNNLILNGVELSGVNIKLKDNQIKSVTNYQGILWWGEKSGDYIEITDNVITTTVLTSSGIYIEPTVSNITLKTVKIKDNFINSPKHGVQISPQSASATNFIINKLDMADNEITTNDGYPLYILPTSVATVQIDDFVINGGKLISSVYRPIYVKVVETGTIRINNASIIAHDASDYGMVIIGGNDVFISGCSIIGESISPYSAYNLFANVGILQIVDNTISNFSANSGIRFDGADVVTTKPSTAIVRGNRFNNVTGSILSGSVPLISLPLGASISDGLLKLSGNPGTPDANSEWFGLIASGNVGLITRGRQVFIADTNNNDGAGSVLHHFKYAAPTEASANTALRIDKDKWQFMNTGRQESWGTAAPTTGTWGQGDKRHNTTPTELGTAGSKYIVDGWVCTVAGTPGTWVEKRCLTGN